MGKPRSPVYGGGSWGTYEHSYHYDLDLHLRHMLPQLNSKEYGTIEGATWGTHEMCSFPPSPRT